MCDAKSLVQMQMYAKLLGLDGGADVSESKQYENAAAAVAKMGNTYSDSSSPNPENYTPKGMKLFNRLVGGNNDTLNWLMMCGGGSGGGGCGDLKSLMMMKQLGSGGGGVGDSTLLMLAMCGGGFKC